MSISIKIKVVKASFIIKLIIISYSKTFNFINKLESISSFIKEFAYFFFFFKNSMEYSKSCLKDYHHIGFL